MKSIFNVPYKYATTKDIHAPAKNEIPFVTPISNKRVLNRLYSKIVFLVLWPTLMV